MTSTDIASASKIIIGSTLASAMYIGSEKFWPVELHDYSLDYFTIESLEDSNTIRIVKNGSAPNISLSYSTDNGTTWTDLTVSASIDLTTIGIGDKIIFKGTNSTLSSNYNIYWRFAPSKKFNVYGNAMSLLFGDTFINNSEFASGTTYNLCGLFWNTTTLINAKNLILPATTATYHCYLHMFTNCRSLVNAPELPATTLADYCYLSMFQSCKSLITAPKLPATTLANYCYSNMFYDCTNLITVPSLPATVLANYCYYSMFYGCKSLITAPKLSATTLANHCCDSMFYDCTNLTIAPSLPATTLADYCYNNMLRGCTSLITAPELPATTLANYCYLYMFMNCRSLVNAPELPATVLANCCYLAMFSGCTSLITAPALPATTLANYCYSFMFRSCTSLNYIKAMFTTTPSTTYTLNWVNDVASSGTFVKNSAATWNVTGVSGVPSGWTVLTSSS